MKTFVRASNANIRSHVVALTVHVVKGYCCNALVQLLFLSWKS